MRNYYITKTNSQISEIIPPYFPMRGTSSYNKVYINSKNRIYKQEYKVNNKNNQSSFDSFFSNNFIIIFIRKYKSNDPNNKY